MRFIYIYIYLYIYIYIYIRQKRIGYITNYSTSHMYFASRPTLWVIYMSRTLWCASITSSLVCAFHFFWGQYITNLWMSHVHHKLYGANPSYRALPVRFKKKEKECWHTTNNSMGRLYITNSIVLFHLIEPCLCIQFSFFKVSRTTKWVVSRTTKWVMYITNSMLRLHHIEPCVWASQNKMLTYITNYSMSHLYTTHTMRWLQSIGSLKL